jgi:hypothetical protein
LKNCILINIGKTEGVAISPTSSVNSIKRKVLLNKYVKEEKLKQEHVALLATSPEIMKAAEKALKVSTTLWYIKKIRLHLRMLFPVVSFQPV